MRKMAALVFPGFQTLDFFGPIEMLGGLLDDIEISVVSSDLGLVPSRHGQSIQVERTFDQVDQTDILFIPGGDSALTAAKDPHLIDWIARTSDTAERVLAVCTGTILLGLTGVLDGRRATTNKLDFNATVPLVPNVEWVKQARWVRDGKFYTSSGVSAGMDMALAVVEDLCGSEKAEYLAETTEYTWQRDPDMDPFAKLAGLVD